MASNGKKSSDLSKDEGVSGLTVRFDEKIYTDDDTPIEISLDNNDNVNLTNRNRPNGQAYVRRKSGILKRRENTITTASAPPIILSDEGLTAGRVSPFINFRLFLSMTIRSVGIIFGDM